jgi:hypothetical protein
MTLSKDKIAACAPLGREACRSLSKDDIIEVRRQYAAGVPVADIRAQFELANGTLYTIVDGVTLGLPPLPRRHVFATRPACQRGTPANKDDEKRGTSTNKHADRRRVLVERLWRAAGKQVRAIERRLGDGEQDVGERERDARMLAVLVKTLRELAALDFARNSEPPPSEPDDDDPVPRDIDEFRRELARRIQAFVASRDGGAAPAAVPDDNQ